MNPLLVLSLLQIVLQDNYEELLIVRDALTGQRRGGVQELSLANDAEAARTN